MCVDIGEGSVVPQDVVVLHLILISRDRGEPGELSVYEACSSNYKGGINKQMPESVISHFSLLLTWVLGLFNL